MLNQVQGHFCVVAIFEMVKKRTVQNCSYIMLQKNLLGLLPKKKLGNKDLYRKLFGILIHVICRQHRPKRKKYFLLSYLLANLRKFFCSDDIEIEMDVSEHPLTSGVQTMDQSSTPDLGERKLHPAEPGPSNSAMLEAENYLLQKQIEELKAKLQQLSLRFSFQHMKDNEDLVLLYTGLPNSKIFLALYNLVKDIEINYYFNWKVTKIEKIDQILMCLMKLRHNFPHGDLAQRFGVSQATVSNIVITWIHVLHSILFNQLMKNIPSRNKNKTCLPTCFSTFSNCRVILDCTEMYTVSSRSSMKTQKITYSSYKHNNTWKALIGVAPNGIVTFVSDLYPGSTSDKKIVQDCKILEQLEAGDLILADKGFLLKDILPPGVHINVPPFLTNPQFTPEQVLQTESIARARIHVERAIQRMKCFKILKFLPHQYIQFGNIILQVIGALTSLQYPLIKEVEKYYEIHDVL